ncbi:hypothetical protein MN116_004519 [Schistosoma mekongi]|uniref:Uncharacterized protein n=1 Tax=Schistosoma mekongi TaxID=38744 RepID=A0AAE1ZG29_SCHME|nr:hypothetical protein MN116_004519 [Schistosoma mekongi]
MLILQINMHLLYLSLLLSIQILQMSTNISYSINSAQSLLSQQKIITPEDHLIETIYNNSNNYNCDFNHLQFCLFEHSSDWSFQLSLSEFAIKMKEAAEIAAKNVQNFHVKLSQNNRNNNTIRNQNKILSNSQYSQLPSVLIPTINYFPCSTNQSEHSYMKLNIQWPTYYVTHRPIVPEDVTISASESTSSSDIQSQFSSFTSSSTTTSTRRRKRSIHYQVKQSNKNLISRQLYTFSKSIPIACLQLKIRFLPGSSMLGSKVVLRLGANKQIIRNVFNIDESFDYEDIYYYDDNGGNTENDMTLTSSYPFTQSRMISKLDWSILRQYISDLENNTLPYNVWINVTMPIYATGTTNPAGVYNQNTSSTGSIHQESSQSVNDRDIMKLTQFTENLIEQSDNWIAIHSMQTLFLYSTNNVCIDDISLLCNINQQFSLSTCQRRLTWINSHKQMNLSKIHNLNLNTFGYPIVNSTNSMNSNRNLIVQSFKSLNSSRYLVYNRLQLIWIAGSLILAVFITFLTILFIITFTLSIICDQRKTHHLSTEYNISSQNEKYQNNNFLLNKQRNHRKFCLNHHCNNELLRFSLEDINSSLVNKLHNHLSTSSSFHGVLSCQQLNEQQQQQTNQQIVSQRQQFIDDNSTELSLCMQDDKNQLIHSINKQNIVNSSDTSVTSALQLLRNWNFYKQRNNASCCYYSPPGSSFVNRPTCCLSPNNVMMKYPGIKRNAFKTSTSLYADHHNLPLLGRGRIDSDGTTFTTDNTIGNLHNTLEENVMYRCQSRVGSPYLHNQLEVRQSLILSVNENNELVILPSSTVVNHNQLNRKQTDTSIDNKHNEHDHILYSNNNSNNNNNNNNNNNICSMLNSLSEEDAETTRLEMAASVNALDQYLHNDNTLDGIVDASDYTLSTIPHSIMLNNEPPPIYSDSSL